MTRKSFGDMQLGRRSFLGAALAAPPVLAYAQANPQGADRISLRCDFSPWGIQAALHLAEVKGWFKDAGLVVDVQDGRGSGNTLQLVNAGQVDVGQIQVGLLGQAREHGASVKSFACFDRRTDLAAIVDRDGPLKKVADFKGKSVLCFAASPWAPFIDAWLKTAGLDRSSVNIMMVDPSALWGTYMARRADALLSTVPSALPLANTQRVSRGVLAEDAGIGFPSYGLIATEAMLKQKPEPLRRLLKTQQRAWEYIKTHIDEGVDAVIRQRPDARLDRGVLAGQIQYTIDFFDTPSSKGKPIGFQTEEDWTKGLHSMETAGVVKPGWKLADYYTNDLIG